MFYAKDDVLFNRKKVEDMPIYKKGREIIDVVRQISALIPEDDAIAAIAYSVCLERCGAVTGKSCRRRVGRPLRHTHGMCSHHPKSRRELYVSYHSFKMHGFDHAEYFLDIDHDDD